MLQKANLFDSLFWEAKSFVRKQHLVFVKTAFHFSTWSGNGKNDDAKRREVGQFFSVIYPISDWILLVHSVFSLKWSILCFLFFCFIFFLHFVLFLIWRSFSLRGSIYWDRMHESKLPPKKMCERVEISKRKFQFSRRIYILSEGKRFKESVFL